MGRATMSDATARVAIAARCALGEAPRWDASAGALDWVDVSAGRWHRGDGSTRALGERLSWVGARRGGGHAALVDGTLTLLRADGAVESVRPLVAPGSDLVLNDAECDARGVLWFGTVGSAPRAGALLRLEPGGDPEVVVSGVSMSNGIAWSPDGATLYHVDSASGTVDAFACDPAGGALRDRRRVIAVPAGAGVPDGLTVDAEGDLWLALWGAGEVRRHRPDGSLRATIAVGASQVTSCAFGGADLDELWITTAREGLDAAALRHEPQAGSIFACTPGAIGVAAHAFAG
jgi:sugar lactone lactonase YvrE